MFVVQNQFINRNEVYSLHTESLYKKGAREFKKLNSFPLLHCNRLVLQRALFYKLKNFYKMQNRKKITKKASKELLTEIRLELQENYPLLKRLKVKPFYNTGRVIAHASLGKRRIRVTGSLLTVVDKFITEYQDRLPTAFTNLNIA